MKTTAYFLLRLLCGIFGAIILMTSAELVTAAEFSAETIITSD